MTKTHYPSDSFVLRIWWERDTPPVWRGWVQHAGSGDSRYFENLADLLGFLETRTGLLVQAPSDLPDGDGDASDG